MRYLVVLNTYLAALTLLLFVAAITVPAAVSEQSIWLIPLLIFLVGAGALVAWLLVRHLSTLRSGDLGLFRFILLTFLLVPLLLLVMFLTSKTS